MTIRDGILISTATLFFSCFTLWADGASAATLTDSQAAAVTKDVREFAAAVSRVVTQRDPELGPKGWRFRNAAWSDAKAQPAAP